MRNAIVGAIIGLGLVYAHAAGAVDMLRDEQGPTEAKPAATAEKTKSSDAAQHATRQGSPRASGHHHHHKKHHRKPHHKHYYHHHKGYHGEHCGYGHGHYGHRHHYHHHHHYGHQQQHHHHHKHQHYGKHHPNAKKSNSTEPKATKTSYNDDNGPGALDANRASMINNRDH
ncbi:MAG: hypothetical protein BGO43_16020 [Gammaproteobacteria bacterium 39-13]|nr:hypothetical protein [Gammaproteobacteria bacterium]OJV87909.1 MAG: hypothetical protein BGO43_16020 [Gammaproteobacteria bacterium 39-13]